MYEQVEKPKDKKTMGVANSVEQNKGTVGQDFEFMDYKFKRVVSRKTQAKVGRAKSKASVIQLFPEDDESEQDSAPKLTDTLKLGIDKLIEYKKVKEVNKDKLISDIKNANETHKKVNAILNKVFSGKGIKVQTYMQGSGGQVQNALSLIGAQVMKDAVNEEEKNEKIKRMVYNFCAVYDPNHLDFSDIDILIPVDSTATFGTEILTEIVDGLNKVNEIENAEIRSAAIRGGNSSFSHIFFRLADRDIDLVIQDQRFASDYAPRFPHMAARADMKGNPGFIRTEREDFDADETKKFGRRGSIKGFTDLTGNSVTKTRDKVTAHMSGGGNEVKNEIKNFDFEKIKKDIETDLKEIRVKFLESLRDGSEYTSVSKMMEDSIGRWKKKKEEGIRQVTNYLQKLKRGNVEHNKGPKRVEESNEFRKNQKQYYKPAPINAEGQASEEAILSVKAFKHMLGGVLDPGEMDMKGVIDYTASLLFKKGYHEKSKEDKVDMLNKYIESLDSVLIYFKAIDEMEITTTATKNSEDYFKKQIIIYKSLLGELK